MHDPEALRWAIRGLVLLALASFAAALIFGVSFGLVSPVFRKLASRLRRKHRELRATQRALAGLKNDLAAGAGRLKDCARRERLLEQACSRYEAELIRIDTIRQRTEEGCARKNAELESERTKTAGLISVLNAVGATERHP